MLDERALLDRRIGNGFDSDGLDSAAAFVRRDGDTQLAVLHTVTVRFSGEAGQPVYMPPDSAISPDVRRVCSSNIEPSSIEAPDRRRDPDRMAELRREDVSSLRSMAQLRRYSRGSNR